MDDALNQLRKELAGRYEVEQELGHGGMAVVYLAKDLRHGRKVAIKVLRQDVGGASAERFLREIRTVAQLHHPHILQLIDSGTAADHLFYVMPYVEGETIRQRLEREGPFPIEEAVRIAREVADGLAFAHARGIVHRDIKPENIFLSAGHALVADFGIARAAETAAGTTLTDVGLAVGTPAYMSPEQATAEPRLDGRSDQYALGCVLYEMLSGAPPFTGPTSQSIMARHTADPVPPLRTVRDVPVALESAITKALAKIPADRWTSTTAFAQNLDTDHAPQTVTGIRIAPWALAASIFGLVLIGAMAWRAGGGRLGRGSTTERLRSVAVAPFYYSDSLVATFADGISENLLTGLSNVPGLRFPGVSSDRLRLSRRRGDDQRQIARDVGASLLVTGEIRLRGELVRVTPKIIDVRSGDLVWQDNFDGELGETDTGDIFRITDEMAQRIVAALLPTLTPDKRVAVARGNRTKSREAYELYVEARRSTFEITLAGAERAIALLNRALELDSMFADAWLARADAHGIHRQVGSLPPAEVTARMRNDLERAIELDSLNGYAFAVRAELRALNYWDFDGARRDLQRALALSPSSAHVEWLYAAAMNLYNEPDSALAHMRRAVELDPTDGFLWANLGIRFNYLAWPDSAVRAANQAVKLDSTLWLGHVVAAQAHQMAGRIPEAERAANEVLRLTGDSLPLALALVSEVGGMGPGMLDRLTQLSQRQFVPAIYLAMARAATGDRAGALRAVEESADSHEMDLVWFVDGFEVLSGDPRYEAVRRRIFGDRMLALRSKARHANRER